MAKERLRILVDPVRVEGAPFAASLLALLREQVRGAGARGRAGAGPVPLEVARAAVELGEPPPEEGMPAAAVRALVGSSPASRHAELLTSEWLRSMCGLNFGTSGIFVSSASAGFLSAVTLAREHVLGASWVDQLGARLYCSERTTPALQRGALLAGLGRAGVRRLPVGEDQRLDLSQLARAVEADRVSGSRPFCVVANAGTADCGAVDDLPALARFCREQGLWLHVDGSHGAAAAISERGRRSLQGLQEADSLTIDLRAWLSHARALGCLLVRRPALLDEGFRQRAAYFNRIEASEPSAAPWGSEALELWTALKTTGAVALREAIDRGLALAQVAEEEVRLCSGWRIVTPAQLAIVTFRFQPEGLDDASADALQQRMCQEAVQAGLAMVGAIVLDGRVVCRMGTLHPHATEAAVRGAVRWLARRAGML